MLLYSKASGRSNTKTPTVVFAGPSAAMGVSIGWSHCLKARRLTMHTLPSRTAFSKLECPWSSVRAAAGRFRLNRVLAPQAHPARAVLVDQLQAVWAWHPRKNPEQKISKKGKL